MHSSLRTITAGWTSLLFACAAVCAQELPPAADSAVELARPAGSAQQTRPVAVGENAAADAANWSKPLGEIRLVTRADAGPLPADTWNTNRGPAIDGCQRKPWALTAAHWTPTNFWHKPLYFDEMPLERHGQTLSPAVQPFVSGAHFFGTLPVLPYKMGVDRPCDHIYTLGQYQPGSPAPCLRERLPWELDAAAIEAGAWVGLVFLLP